MNIYIISDTHFSHAKMLEYEARPKGFEIQIMNNILRTVQQKDILIHLGDVCIGEDIKNNFFFSQLTCNKWLIRGNHDRKSFSFYNQYWDFVGDSIFLEMFNKKILFTHRPTIVEKEIINIHGHCHSAKREGELLNDDRHILVKMEHEYRPFSLRKLLKA